MPRSEKKLQSPFTQVPDWLAPPANSLNSSPVLSSFPTLSVLIHLYLTIEEYFPRTIRKSQVYIIYKLLKLC